MSEVYEQFKKQIIAATFMTPLIGGAILYYGLRKRDLDIANKANRLSWYALFMWIGLGVVSPRVGTPVEVLNTVGGVIGLIGIAVAIMVYGNLKGALKARDGDASP